MTSSEFQQRLRHAVGGHVLDVLCSGATGAERMLNVERLLKRINETADTLYHELTRPAPNGQAGGKQHPKVEVPQR